ncbi:MAG TPA: hypothetical protein VIM69_06200 [Opitutaceae bacterium]
MKPAVRNGATLLILLLAVFPCGAALTVLGTIVIKLVRALMAGNAIWATVRLLAIPILRCAAGVVGFLSIIPSVDKLMVADRRLAKRELLGIILGIFFATQFLISYLLHLSALKMFRLVCIGPIAIEILLLIYHLVRCGGKPPLRDEPGHSASTGSFRQEEKESDQDSRHALNGR